MHWNFYFAFKNWCWNWRSWNSFTYFNIFHYYVHINVHSWHYLQNWTILWWKKMLVRWLFGNHWTLTSYWWNSKLYKKIFCRRIIRIIQNLRNDLDSRTLRVRISSTRKGSSHIIIAKIVQKWKVTSWTWNCWNLKINLIAWRKVREFCGQIPLIIASRQTSFLKCNYCP